MLIAGAPRSAPGNDEQQDGFTLVELLVVVVIIGILTAIAVPVFLSQRERSWETAVEADLRNAMAVVESYYADNSDYYVGGPDELGDHGLRLSDGVEVTYFVDENGQVWCMHGSHERIGGQPIAVVYARHDGGFVDAETCADVDDDLAQPFVVSG